LSTPPDLWSWREESNLRLADHESVFQFPRCPNLLQTIFVETLAPKRFPQGIRC